MRAALTPANGYHKYFRGERGGREKERKSGRYTQYYIILNSVPKRKQESKFLHSLHSLRGSVTLIRVWGTSRL